MCTEKLANKIMITHNLALLQIEKEDRVIVR